MSVDFIEKQWGCGAPGANLQRVSSMVCDIVDPCLHPSPIKLVVAVNRMLKPEKWQSVFDSDGKAFGFQKALKLITVGGIDPSIRPEVWEFLLGCYALSSTKEYRKLLREARRERYEELVKQCKKMHSSIGTGSLAYVVGSKIMDVRTYSKEDSKRQSESEERRPSDENTNKLDDYCDNNNSCTDTSYTPQRASSSDSSDILSVRERVDAAAYDPSCLVRSPVKFKPSESGYPPVDFFDFPPLPVTNLFERSDDGEDRDQSLDERAHTENMHSFQIGSNEELIVESNDGLRHSVSSEIEMGDGNCEESHEELLRRDIEKYKNKVLDRLRISDVPETSELYSSTVPGVEPSEDKVSEWLWTLHRIVVDVVRTDSHLEFYENPKNLARMSDILAVYAWVDPETGYCQGMSDLLSPFVVLFDNDADAFWCFEMLLRRTRENFRMEGETGVMKQLQTLWHILKLTDREMFSHLSHIGAESLHFAFRMLLVLFRRELSFTEALCMWEMMWAADFDESLAWNLSESCLKPLSLQIPNDLSGEIEEDKKEADESSSKGGSHSRHESSSKGGSHSRHESSSKGGSHSRHESSSKGGSHLRRESVEHPGSDEAVMRALTSNHSFCGLTKSLWSKNDRMHVRTEFTVSRNKEDELPVFCVAAILILNRHKIIKETRSLDDLIKVFNDNMLTIKVRRCIRTAVKLRKKYFYKQLKPNNPTPEDESNHSRKSEQT